LFAPPTLSLWGDNLAHWPLSAARQKVFHTHTHESLELVPTPRIHRCNYSSESKVVRALCKPREFGQLRASAVGAEWKGFACRLCASVGGGVREGNPKP
jgi:hypothetical protein